MYEITAGKTSQLIDIFLQDSSKTTGVGLAGLVFNTSGLTCYYKRQGQATWTAVTLGTMTQGTWATGGFVEGDATHAPGMYEFGIPDAAIASAAGVFWVDLYFQGAANMAPVPLRVMLKAVDFQDSVRAGLTALPNAAAGGVSGLPLAVDSSGRPDLAATGLDQVVMSDLTAIPAATASVKSAINYLFQKFRNKRTQTATTETGFKDNSSTSWFTSTKSDDGTTLTKGKDT